MSSDKLLQDLAREALAEQREERSRLPEIWDDLSAGELSPAQEAELAELAETSEEARIAYEAFRPLDAAFRDGVVAAVEAQASDREVPARDRPKPLADGPERLTEWLKKIFSFEQWQLPAGAAAAAAAVLLLVTGLGVEPPPLPGYQVELTGGVTEMRSGIEGTDIPIFVPGSGFELILRPLTAVSGKVEVRCFLDRDATIEPWEVTAEIAQAGTVRIAGEIGRELEIDPGKWTLWAAVGRPGKLPNASQIATHLEAGGGNASDWLLLRAELRIEQNAR